MTFKEKVEQELKDLTRKQKVAFAWRCAIRALPILGNKGAFDFWEETDRQKHLHSIFFALDASAAYVVAVTAFVYAAATPYAAVAAAASASAAAYTAAYAADTAAYADAAAYTAAYAADTAYASAAADASCYARDVAEAADAADAIDATAKRMNIDLEQMILEDLKAIKNNQQPKISILLYGEIWDDFQTALKKEGCEYWGVLYQDLFNNDFALDQEALERRINVPKEIKAQGAAAVGRYLEEI